MTWRSQVRILPPLLPKAPKGAVGFRGLLMPLRQIREEEERVREDNENQADGNDETAVGWDRQDDEERSDDADAKSRPSHPFATG